MVKPLVIILGAGRPYRGDEPSALTSVSGDKCVLDWLMDAFARTFEAEFHFVAGYGLDEVANRYPELLISINPQWEESGSLGSLMAAPLSPDRLTYVCYADVLLRSSAVSRLHQENTGTVIGVDSCWLNRYQSRQSGDLMIAEKVKIEGGQVSSIGSDLSVSDSDAEFSGLVRLSHEAVNFLIELRDNEREQFTSKGLPDLISLLNSKKHIVRTVDIHGEWAELNAPQDMARFIFGTKAETLERLGSLVQKSCVGDQVDFQVGEWLVHSDQLIANILDKFGGNELAVRSSASTEDGWEESNAGCFTSLLNVPSESDSISKAVEEVIASYGDNDPSHRVLVQEMIKDVKMSGVIFSRTLNHGAPYFVVNYDDVSSSTDAVTSGSGGNLKTAIIHRKEGKLPRQTDPIINKLIDAVHELEYLVGHDSLDIEFAVTTDDRVHLLQLRPIAVEHGGITCGDLGVENAVFNAEKTVRARQKKQPFMFGETTYFGVMPDWNPAEIIGTKPKRLALSLYQYLVTNEVWAKQRAEHGYRDLYPYPLMITLAGHPYIDVRASFNSFIPACLPGELAGRLVESYLDRFNVYPHLHDKIEFEIVFTCLSFDFPNLAQERLYPQGFTDVEVENIREALLSVTRISFERVGADLATIQLLKDRFYELIQSDHSPLDKAYMLLVDCKRYGTLPFAHLARAGFIAVTLLRSLQKHEVLTEQQVADFLNHLNTVTRELESDGEAVFDSKMDWELFVEKYGHLRPGTYDITSQCYFADPDKYLKPMVKKSKGKKDWEGWGSATNHKIETYLDEFGFELNFEQFEQFLRDAITGREYSKFIFTRNLSAALESIADFGEDIGLSREVLSHVNVEDLFALRDEGFYTDSKEYLSKVSKDCSLAHQIVQSIELPPVVCSEDDLWAFQLPRSYPNFVTTKKVLADAFLLVEGAEATKNIQGKIILIPSADPGFDWLFGYKVSGLITMYGGANSHMTIRAAEMGLPAAIGVGEVLFEQLLHARMIELDCQARQIRVQ